MNCPSCGRRVRVVWYDTDTRHLSVEEHPPCPIDTVSAYVLNSR